jgi:DNA-binding beta-propeller fold protein YncE
MKVKGIMRRWFYILICPLVLLSCTAIVEQRRPEPGGSSKTVQAFKIAQLNINDAGPSMCSSLRGDIFVTDAGGWRLLSYKNDGSQNYESSISSGRSFLLNGQANGVYLVDDLNKRIQYFDVWGQKQNIISYSGSSFVSGAALKDGSLYLLDNLANTVVVLDNQGQEARRFRLMAGNTGWQWPTALAVDGTGTVLATADVRAGKVTIFNIYGSYLGKIDVTPSASPSAICFEPGKAVLWVCEKDAGRLSSFEVKPSGIYPGAVCIVDNPLSVTCSAFGGIYAATNKYLMNISEE